MSPQLFEAFEVSPDSLGVPAQINQCRMGVWTMNAAELASLCCEMGDRQLPASWGWRRACA